ncbi:NmrA family NAD(P)-binding protein [Nocardia sp. NPDC057227]|uniref:NmrA family NAD(P)-binding protein n=1 Tax=Nocardia sp. NPDC057227 TaxID=3346056 RepID=UPI003634F745
MAEHSDSVLVVGATGQQGGATARGLLAAGVPVRALVRDPAAPAAVALAAAGAALVTGDLDDPPSLAAAVAGARAVFLIPPSVFGAGGWDSAREAERGRAVVDAARRGGVEQIVFSGVARTPGHDSRDLDGKTAIEEAVAESGLRYTLLRPVRFMENYLLRAFVVDGIVDGVNRHIFPADEPLSMIALADIADFAVLALTDPARFDGQALQLAGDAPTPRAAADAISAATGDAVRYHELSEAEADAIAPMIGDAWRAVRRTGGWRADLPALRTLHPGLRDLRTWLSTGGAAAISALGADTTAAPSTL